MSYHTDLRDLFLSQVQQKLTDLGEMLLLLSEEGDALEDCLEKTEKLAGILSLFSRQTLSDAEEEFLIYTITAEYDLGEYHYRLYGRPSLSPAPDPPIPGITIPRNHQELIEVLGGDAEGVGWHFTESQHQQLLNLLIIEPTVTFGLNPSLAEKGTSISLTLSYGITTGTYTPQSRQLLQGTTSLELDTPPIVLNGSFSVPGTLAYDNASLAFTLKATFENQIKTDTKTLVFEAPCYYGAGSASMNESAVKAGLTKVVTGKTATQSYLFSPVAQRYHYLYPASWGTLTKITDKNGYDVTAAFSNTPITFTLADGTTTEVMNHYTSNINTTTTAFRHTFYF